jgi:hypothetical protein
MMLLHDRACVYFSGEFLVNPTPGWSVDWSTSDVDNDKCTPPLPGQEQVYLAAHDGPHGSECIRGTLVKCENPQRVWKLTGKYDAASHGYEGVWPD